MSSVAMTKSPDMSSGAASGSLLLEDRIDELAVARQRGGLDEFVVPFDGERLRLLVDQRLDEREQVLRVQSRRARRETARHVEISEDTHAVLGHDGLATARGLDIAAALHREIDDDGA